MRYARFGSFNLGVRKITKSGCVASGYCGADLRALCTETALLALRHRYPQIYLSKEKLQLDVSSIIITARNFYDAMQVWLEALAEFVENQNI